MTKLIVEMEMPKSCWDCSCCDSEYRYCAARKKTLDELNERPDWCPICGVLPDEHGDLVDRSLLCADLVGVILSHRGLGIDEVIARQPAIIAAER